ncbi:site-specific integrase [Geomonas nitrogeniifigens]|uniref:site-specific integrase n=1 Tax=Geomonas diazotrophica TaxID=2843197 RepID=UPI001C2CA2B1|nr:site-specific integrase [Geomonas nitrogeniifigens]QXE86447.1 site-specific integrase [Geomonas nitrogeniifigens]
MRLLLLKFNDGERFPVLVDDSNIPLFTPTVYTTSMLRSNASSYETLVLNLKAIMLLYTWAQSSGFCIEDRFKQLSFLSLEEIESLVYTAKLSYRGIREALEPVPGRKSLQVARLVRLEAFRTKVQQDDQVHVSPATTNMRLRAILHFLEWLANESLARVAHDSNASTLKLQVDQMKRALRERIPRNKKWESGKHREGLLTDLQEQIFEVINPASAQNPWKGEHSRVRNEVLIKMLIDLGLRCGEVLVLRIRDVDLGVSELRVRRAPDEAEDPRVRKPNAKTLSRNLLFDDDLREKLQHYILKLRSQIRGARRHPYLFVATGTGAPLSYPAVCKIFKQLREASPDLPSWFTAHICRYTWNDNFSASMDEQGIAPQKEMELREYLQGWARGSKMPAKYTKRHIRKKAGEVSLEMQKKTLKRRTDDNDAK